MDRLESLKFFIRLVEKKGIALAGRDFGMSPATASEKLAALETHYGAKLVNRTTRSISLTDEGRILLKGARDLIDDSNDLETRISQGMNQVSGPIKISAPQDLGRTYFAPLMDAFVKEHPNIHIQLHLDDNYNDLVQNGVDLSVRLGPMVDSSLRARKLAPNRRIVCASPEYLSSHGTPAHPSELQEHNCLIMHSGDVIDNEWNFQIAGQAASFQVSGNLSANNGAQVKDWCLRGCGIAYKSYWDVKHHLKNGELVELLQDFQSQQNTCLQLLFPGGRDPARRVRTLIQYLTEHFKDVHI